MVFGPYEDARRAAREGRSVVSVISETNRLVNTLLPMHVKVSFWLTNVPYFALAYRCACVPPPHVNAPLMHSLALSIVALVSSAFHGSVLFGSSDSSWPTRLLPADLLAANTYGLALASSVGLSRVLSLFALPLLLLFAAAKLKRRGHLVAYAVGHGAWHVMSAAAMHHCLFSAASAVG